MVGDSLRPLVEKDKGSSCEIRIPIHLHTNNFSIDISCRGNWESADPALVRRDE